MNSTLFSYTAGALKKIEKSSGVCISCRKTDDELLESGKKVNSLVHNSGAYMAPHVYTDKEVFFLCEDCAPSSGEDKRLEEATRGITETLKGLQCNLSDENFAGTPGRVSRFLLGHFRPLDKVADELYRYKLSSFPSDYRGIVSQSGIKASGLCPHHFLPVIYDVDVAYVPGGRAVGLSKLARLVKTIGNLPLLQEDFTNEVAAQIREMVGANDIAVIVRGTHTCMSTRGVSSSAPTVTSCMEGDFFFDINSRNEVLELFKRGRI